MAMGLCCQWLEPDKKGRPKNVLVRRNLQLGRFNRGEYSRDRIKKTYVDNLKNLVKGQYESELEMLKITMAEFNGKDCDINFNEYCDNEINKVYERVSGEVEKESHKLENSRIEGMRKATQWDYALTRIGKFLENLEEEKSAKVELTNRSKKRKSKRRRNSCSW